MKIESRDKMTVEEKRMKKGDTILVTSRWEELFLGKSLQVNVNVREIEPLRVPSVTLYHNVRLDKNERLIVKLILSLESL